MVRDLRWECGERGCFRKAMCPKLGAFDVCFPGRIGMTDVDGFVEVGGRFLLIEWKSAGGALGTGQRIAFERLTALSPLITVAVVSGEPREPAVSAVQIIREGRTGPVVPSDTAALKARVEAWARRASIRRAA